MSDRVKAILKEIERLPEKDRIEFDSAFTSFQEKEFRKLRLQAKRHARAKGITDETIRRVIERRRYGRALP